MIPREPHIPASPKILLSPPLSSKKIVGSRGNGKPLLLVKTAFVKGAQCLTFVSTLPREQTRSFPSKFARFCRTVTSGSEELSLFPEPSEPPTRPMQLAGYSGFNKRSKFSSCSPRCTKCFQSKVFPIKVMLPIKVWRQVPLSPAWTCRPNAQK